MAFFDHRLGGYQMVVALTQEMINRGLEELFKKSNKNNKAKRLGTRDCWATDLEVGVPEVMITYDSNTQSGAHVIYRVHAKSGKFFCFSAGPDDPSSEQLEGTIDNWYFAFAVDLGLTDAMDAEQLKKVREKLDHPDDYTISRLMINLKDANLSRADLKNCDFKGFESKISGYAQDQLYSFMAKSVTKGGGGSDLRDFDFNTIAYSAQWKSTAVENSPKATFYPTGLQYQTYPWSDPSSGSPVKSGMDGNSRLNYLLYLECTNHSAMPQGKEVFLPFTGKNWTSGRLENSQPADDFMLGSLVLGQDCFFERWLLPRLEILNKQNTIRLAGFENHCFWDSSYRVEGNILIGDDPDNKPEQWAFKQLDTGAASDWSVPYDVNTMLQQGALCWYYRKVYDQDPGHDQAAATISIKITGKSTTSVYVVYVPGTAEIKVMGWNDVYLYNEVWRGVYQHATSRTDKFQSESNWWMKLQLMSVNDGGLQIKIPSKDAGGRDSAYTNKTDQKDLNYRVGGWGDWCATYMQKQLEWIGNLENDLANDLAAANRLVLPAAGVFDYKDPVLTKSGSLLCRLNYRASAIGFGDGDKRGATNTAPGKSGTQGVASDATKGKAEF